mgnify:CR=1 FL=1
MISTSTFRPAWWLPGPHLQTLWPRFHRRPGTPYLRRERLKLPDGDFIDLDWTGGDGRPRVLLLHGLEGSSSSPYARGLGRALHDAGLQVAVMHFRGCSGEANRLVRGYHSGDSADLALVAGRLLRREPTTPLGAVGISLGGNVLLKWLGETGADNPLTAAAAVSVPFDLARSVARLQRGVSRLYHRSLLRQMRASLRRKAARLGDWPIAVPESALTDFRAFDEHVTAPLNGFAGAADYYRRASCRPFLETIDRPTLILHARDDPFVPPEAIPAASELGPAAALELSERGGHVGFIAGRIPGRPVYWLERRLPAFFAAHLAPGLTSDAPR